MENFIRIQHILGNCLIFVCVFNNIFSTYAANFDDLCRYEGICLNCSEGGCEDMCHFYDNNCCVRSSSTNILLKKWQYSCVRTFPDMYDLHLDCRGSFDGVYGVYTVTKCSELWTDDSIKSKCEQSPENDILSKVPVYDALRDMVTYRNMYCAFCNMLALDRLRFWAFDLMCNEINENDWDNCFVRLRYRRHRMCAMDVTESCSVTANVEPSLRDKCENGLSQNVYIWEGRHQFRVYKNEFCAQCNYEAGEMQCWAFQAFTCWPEDLPSYNSVKAMMHLNLYGPGNIDSTELFNNRCVAGVLYDPFYKTCLNVTCSQLHNICISGKCHFVELAASEFAVQNDSSLYFFALGDFIQNGRYFVNDISVQVCLDDSQYSEFEIIKQTEFESTTNILNTVVSGGSISTGSTGSGNISSGHINRGSAVIAVIPCYVLSMLLQFIICI